MRKGRNAYRGLVGRSQGKDHLEDMGVNGMNLQETGGMVWTGLVWIRLGTGCGRAVVSAAMNLLGSIKCGEFLE
jgi:hypothetical protein